MSAKHPTAYRTRHYRPIEGVNHLIWAQGIGELMIPVGSKEYNELRMDQAFSENTLADEGEQAILEAYFRGGTASTNTYLRLYNDTPAETDTLSTLTGEVSGTGYPGTNTIESNATGWPTSALDVGDWQIDSKTITWTASGAWSAATYLVLATVASGTGGLLIAYNALSATRTLADGDSLQADIQLKLQ